MIGHDDRRNFYRMMVNADVSMKLDTMDGELIGRCMDLSATGMGVLCNEPIELGQTVEVRLESVDKMVPALKASTRVMRCEAVDNDYLLGLEIIEMS